MAPRPPTRRIRCPRNKSPPNGAYLRDTLTRPQGTPPQLAPHRTRTGRPCPPNPPKPPQRRYTDVFDGEELKAIYDFHANTPPCVLDAALRRHPPYVNPNRLFAVVALRQAASTNISVRHFQVLVTSEMQIADDLVDALIWCFNFNQPDQEGVWAPHLGWAHTLIAPPKEPRPAPTTGGRESAAPQARANALNIPPNNGLGDWETRTAPDRGRNLREMVERYQPGAETARAGPPRREDEPSTISMMVLEGGHYYQVRITPHPQECHLNLEAVESMLPASAALPEGPTPLPQNQPQDSLTAVVSGEAGSWHPGHALYCLWRWAQRRWLHTKDWSATWRFHLDSRQQLEAIHQHGQRTQNPATGNLCLFSRSTISGRGPRGGQLLPIIRSETEARAAHAALVHEIFSAVRNAVVRRHRPWKGTTPAAFHTT